MSKKNSIVIVSKNKSFWMKAEEETKQQVEGLKNALKFQEAILQMLKLKILATR